MFRTHSSLHQRMSDSCATQRPVRDGLAEYRTDRPFVNGVSLKLLHPMVAASARTDPFPEKCRYSRRLTAAIRCRRENPFRKCVPRNRWQKHARGFLENPCEPPEPFRRLRCLEESRPWWSRPVRIDTLVQVVPAMMFLRPSLFQEWIAEGYSAGRDNPLRQNTLPHPLRL
jgi:hypothetical protein